MKKMKKKDLAILCGILALVLVLGGVVLFWVNRYRAQGLSTIRELEGEYIYNGKLLLSSDGETALRYLPKGNSVFETLSLESIPLDPYGFEGKSFDYFRTESTTASGITYVNYYPVSADYEPFWPVCMGDRFVYLAQDGKKYRITPEKELSHPIFADSIEGVDPYGTDVIAFSANASYAIALDGTEVTAYQTDPEGESLRITALKRYSLSAYGTKAEFGSFVGDHEAYFTVSGKKGTVFVALDLSTGEMARSLLDEEGEYGEVISRLYTQRLDREEEKEKENKTLIWCHVLLGTQWESPELETGEDGTILAVSPSGGYAVARLSGNGKEEWAVLSEKRCFSLHEVMQEGEQVERVDFLYENVLAITLTDGEGEKLVRIHKICF